MTFERAVLIFQISSGHDGPAEEIRFKRGHGYLAIANDRSIAVYALLPPPRIESEFAEVELAT